MVFVFHRTQVKIRCKRGVGVPLTGSLNAYNDLHGTYRAAVEQAIGYLKRFAILSGVIRMVYTSEKGARLVHDILKVCVELSAIQVCSFLRKFDSSLHGIGIIFDWHLLFWNLSSPQSISE